MAEIFGAVASGIGIAGVAAQAIDGIRKLQTFCNDVRDAPEEIRYLANELEILLGTIASIQAQIQRNASMCGNLNPTPALRFVDQSVRSLNAVIEKLNGEIAEKRTLGSMKVAWKKKVLEAHLVKIERSKTSLGLAVSAYSTELYLQTAMKTDTRIDQLSVDVAGLAVSCQSTSQHQIDDNQHTASGQQLVVVEDYDKHRTTRKRPMSPKMISVLSFSLMLPHWLAQHSLQISICRAAQTWTVNLRPYRTVTRDSHIWDAIRYGDFDHVRKIIESGQATVFDRLDTGWTLLHEVAIYAPSYNDKGFSHIARFLINHGADINQPINLGMLAIHCFARVRSRDSTSLPTNLWANDIFQLLLDEIDVDPEFFWETSGYNRHNVISPTFEKEFKHLFPLDTLGYPKMTMADRLKDLRFEPSACFSPRELARFLDIESLEIAFPRLDNDTKREVLRGVLHQWGYCSVKRRRESKEWEKTILGLFAAGAKFDMLCGGEEEGERLTRAPEDKAVIEVIRQFAATYVRIKPGTDSVYFDTRGFLDGFANFVSKTKCLGIRLEAGSDCRGFDFCMDHAFLNSNVYVDNLWEPHTLSLYYNGDLSTWMMLDSTFDEYCGEFWDMLEHPERLMPGTWVE